MQFLFWSFYYATSKFNHKIGSKWCSMRLSPCKVWKTSPLKDSFWWKVKIYLQFSIQKCINHLPFKLQRHIICIPKSQNLKKKKNYDFTSVVTVMQSLKISLAQSKRNSWLKRYATNSLMNTHHCIVSDEWVMGSKKHNIKMICDNTSMAHHWYYCGHYKCTIGTSYTYLYD